jgi:hypothetical protein
MTIEQGIFLILLGVAGYGFVIFFELNEKETETKVIHKAKQDAIDQVNSDSRLGTARNWSYDDTVVTHLGNSEGVSKGIQATNIKISEQESILRFCQCYFADARNIFDGFRGEPSATAEIEFADLIGAEISLDEEHTDYKQGTIQGKTQGALVGTLLFGPAGGIVGSAGKRQINSTTKSVKKITAVALEISASSKIMPWIFIPFYSAIKKNYLDGIAEAAASGKANSDLSLGMTEEEIRELPEFKQMRQWYSALQKIIASTKGGKPSSSDGLSEELDKLARLHQDGKLTDEEYRTAKQKVIDL